MTKLVKKMTNDEKATARVLAVLRAGGVLKVEAASGYYTAGAYTPAVGPRGFAVYGYGSRSVVAAREYAGPDAVSSAAWAVVSSCGSTRAREAALIWERKNAVLA